MKWISSAFSSDQVFLSRWDLLKLFFGRQLSDSACKVKVGKP